jgi:hypothetical protein
MKNLIRRITYLAVAGAVIAGSLSGCVVVPEHHYYEGGYYHHYWER